MDEYFFSLPDDVLVNQIFPSLPLTEVARLCSTHTRFARLCAGEELWRIRAFYEFPSEARLKPVDLSWRNYYRFLRERRIPLYYQGDRIAWIPFSSERLDLTLTWIALAIDLGSLRQDPGPVNIVFINKRRMPVVIVKWPEMKIIVKSQNYDSIEKVLVFANDMFEREKQPEPPSVSRGRKPQVEGGRVSLTFRHLLQGKEGMRRDPNIGIIYNQLASSQGTPPIYGLSIVAPRWGYGFDLTAPNDETGEFRVTIAGHLTDPRMVGLPRVCLSFSSAELVQVAQLSGISDELIREAHDRDGKSGLCALIKARLTEIGHIL